MPKSITIHPADIRQKSVIKSQEIPVNAYTVDPAQETWCAYVPGYGLHS